MGIFNVPPVIPTSELAKASAKKAISFVTEAINLLKDSNQSAKTVVTDNKVVISNLEIENVEMDQLIKDNESIVENFEGLIKPKQ